MGVTLSEKAASEVKKIITEQGLPRRSMVLRVGVQGGGCSGFSYSLDFDTADLRDATASSTSTASSSPSRRSSTRISTAPSSTSTTASRSAGSSSTTPTSSSGAAAAARSRSEPRRTECKCKQAPARVSGKIPFLLAGVHLYPWCSRVPIISLWLDSRRL